MPRYFFGFEGQEPEEGGEELPDDGAARAIAAKVAEELGKNLPERPRILFYDATFKLINSSRHLWAHEGL